MNDTENEQQQARRPRFDGTINLGHILTASAMLLGGIVVWTQSQVVQAKQDVRITYVEKTAEKTAESIEKMAELQRQMSRNQDRVTTTLEILMKKPQL